MNWNLEKTTQTNQNKSEGEKGKKINQTQA